MHVHTDHDEQVPAVLDTILAHVRVIEHWIGALAAQGVTIMATLDEVNANMDRLATNLAELAREVGVLASAGPALVTQAQLDDLNAKVSGLADLAKGADPNP